MRVFALPGLDGTGDLFYPLVRAAPRGVTVETVAYPPDRPLGYDAHLEIARSRLPDTGRFLLLGESFSGPIAVRLAAEAPPGLVGLALCATFVRSPSWSGFRHLPWKTLFSRPVPRHVIRRRLAGPWISPEIVASVRGVTRQVEPSVLATRLRETLTVDARDALARVEVPILDLRGTRDRLVPRRCRRAILAVRPDIRTAEIEAPHMLLQIAPREAWAAIERVFPVGQAPRLEAGTASGGSP